MALLDYYEVLTRTTEAKTKFEIISCSQGWRPVNIAGDFHNLGRSLIISLHRIPPIKVETRCRKVFSNRQDPRKYCYQML